jgi:hypothetical protein
MRGRENGRRARRRGLEGNVWKDSVPPCGLCRWFQGAGLGLSPGRNGEGPGRVWAELGWFGFSRCFSIAYYELSLFIFSFDGFYNIKYFSLRLT